MSKNYFQTESKKKTGKTFKPENLFFMPEEDREKTPVMTKGDKLSENYPVYYGYTYFADNELIYSPVQAMVKDLLFELNRQGMKCDNLYRAVF